MSSNVKSILMSHICYRSVKELQITTKTDVFAFGVVLAELITGKRALIRENGDPNKMKSLISIVSQPFSRENETQSHQ